MELTFTEYIGKYYNITERVKARVINPKEVIKNMDSLPYDEILYIDGELQKAVYLDDDNAISVAELLSYTQDEIKKINDKDLTLVWTNYMEQVDLHDVNIMDLISAAQIFMKDKRDKRLGLISCIQ